MMALPSKQAIEFIIFDCDGVLVDSEPISNRVFCEALNKAGVAITLAELFEHYVGLSLEQGLAIINQKYGVLLGPDFLTEYKTARDAALALEIKAITGVEALIRHLTLPFCVASNSEAGKVEKMLGLTGLLPYFAGRIFSAADLGKPKPAPDIYLKIAAEFDVNPAACLVIEDTATGVRAGAAAGMQVIGYSATTSEQALIAAGAVQVFKAMSEIQKVILKGSTHV
ncbi:HAD family hydrolase [Methylophilus flavus]|uniref:HAD family hydrolase n=1 Tax=Methylophilus flavus TaxID=640084 RepID=A0ABW3P8C3_9PROT